MACPRCAATMPRESMKRTQLDYRIFRCSVCQHQFNERTGTPLNHLEFPTNVVLLIILRRLRSKLSLRDLAEMLLKCSLAFTHEAVRAWEARLAPLLTDKLRSRRTGQSKHPSALKACGATTTTASTEMAIWSTPCSMRSAIWTLHAGCLPISPPATSRSGAST